MLIILFLLCGFVVMLFLFCLPGEFDAGSYLLWLLIVIVIDALV